MTILLLIRICEDDTVKDQFIRYGGIKAMICSLKDYFLDMEAKAMAIGCIYKTIIPNILLNKKKPVSILYFLKSWLKNSKNYQIDENNEILDRNVIEDISVNIGDDMTDDDEIKLAVMNCLDLILNENLLIKKLIELSCGESRPLPLNVNGTPPVASGTKTKKKSKKGNLKCCYYLIMTKNKKERKKKREK